MKRVCIHQPDFVPYLGFFDRLLDCDVFILLDDVQFLRRGFHHRDRIKTAKGPVWLTLNLKKGDYYQAINQTLLHPERQRWVPRHLNLIAESYRGAAHFDDFRAPVEEIYRTPFDKLVDINLAFIRMFLDVFAIEVELRLASEFQVAGKSTRRLVELVQAVGGTDYLTGTGALDYLEEDLFNRAGIGLEVQRFAHPTYPQLHGAFVSGLSCLDVLFNCGPEARDVVRSCRAHP